MAKTKKTKIEKEKTRGRKKGMTRLHSLFCGSDQESDSSEEEPVDGDETWEEVNRVKRNKTKQERQNIKKNKFLAATASKANHTVGLGPISKETIKYFEDSCKDTEKAKVEAVYKFLCFYLRYDRVEIEELKIAATQTAPNDDVVYVAFHDVNDVHTVYTRAAQSKHPDIITHNFILPQFFDRYIYLSNKCKEWRDSDKEIKTQMCFGKSDIEVYTKQRGKNEQYKLINHCDICPLDRIPNFNHDIKWRRKFESRDRRRADLSPARGKPPSMCKSSEKTHDMTHSPEPNS